MTYLKLRNEKPAVMASVYLLSPRSAGAMNRCRVPGAYIGDDLFNRVIQEWQVPRTGLKYSIERAARLGVMIKKMGYRGIHIGGIHKSFNTVGRILDRMDELEKQGWVPSQSEFESETGNGFYLYHPGDPSKPSSRPMDRIKEQVREHLPYTVLKTVHNQFFEKKHPLASFYRKVADVMSKNHRAKWFKLLVEDPVKKPVLSCQSCGDCAIQHVAFLCPESCCPKHIRNGACGGSRDGFCEVYPDRECVWVRAYNRLKHDDKADTLAKDFVPPRMWELNNTSSWINFHLGKDHQKKK
jgi:methylenetetrahydrofolate reductase (NADPH)